VPFHKYNNQSSKHNKDKAERVYKRKNIARLFLIMSKSAVDYAVQVSVVYHIGKVENSENQYNYSLLGVFYDEVCFKVFI
jgi:hypothetical protein